jgi:hypothetical protein
MQGMGDVQTDIKNIVKKCESNDVEVTKSLYTQLILYLVIKSYKLCFMLCRNFVFIFQSYSNISW